MEVWNLDVGAAVDMLRSAQVVERGADVNLDNDNEPDRACGYPSCRHCGRWLLAWRAFGKVVEESCICCNGSVVEKARRHLQRSECGEEFGRLLKMHRLVKDGYKINKLLSMTTLTLPSDYTGRGGANNPWCNAVMKIKKV